MRNTRHNKRLLLYFRAAAFIFLSLREWGKGNILPIYERKVLKVGGLRGKLISKSMCLVCGVDSSRKSETIKIWRIVFNKALYKRKKVLLMMAIIGLLSTLSVLVFFVMTIVSLVRKRPAKQKVIGLGVSFAVFVAAFALTPDAKPAATPVRVTSQSSQSSSPRQIEKSKPTKEEIIASVGETLDYNGLKLTLDSVSEYKDNGQYAMDEADAGNVFILLNFTASNETGKDDHINMFFEDSYCDDISIDPEAILFNAKGEAIWGDIADGKKRKGYVAYQVPADWQTIEFYYNAEVFGGSSSKMMFKVSASDLT